MVLKKINIIFGLYLLSGLSTAATTSQFYFLTDNSYYSYSYENLSGDIITDKTTLTGFLQVSIDDSSYTATIDYTGVFLNGSSFRSADTLTTDIAGINSAALISGVTGEYDYISYGNATLSPFPFICVECGYEMTLSLTPNPLVLSYYESNPYGSGEVNFELYISQVPLPSAIWLFGSGLVGLLGLSNRKRT